MGNGGVKWLDKLLCKYDMDVCKVEVIVLVVEIFDVFVLECDDVGKIWVLVFKSVIKCCKLDFNELYYGFCVFGNLLDEV